MKSVDGRVVLRNVKVKDWRPLYDRRLLLLGDNSNTVLELNNNEAIFYKSSHFGKPEARKHAQVFQILSPMFVRKPDKAYSLRAGKLKFFLIVHRNVYLQPTSVELELIGHL